MSQQAIKSRQLVTTKDKAKAPDGEMHWPFTVDYFSFARDGWPFAGGPLASAKLGLNMLKSPDEIAAFGKDAFEAFAKAGTIMADGFKEIGVHFLALAHGSVEANLEAGKEIVGKWSLKDLAEFQSGLVRRFVDSTLGGSTKISEMSARTVAEASKPISAHLGAAFGRLNGLP